MKKHSTFGNAELAQKMASKFGAQEPVKVEMRYAKQVKAFIRKIEEEHQKAAECKLKFG